MLLVKKVLTKFNGLHYPQEYLCFARGSFYQPLHVYLVNKMHVVKEVTNQHLFVGYNPLVFAFPNLGLPQSIQLVFTHQLVKPNEFYSQKDALAFIELELIKEQPAGDTQIVYYRGTRGAYHFLSNFNQYMNRLNNNWYNKKAGNVFLHNNLYIQVQIAYAVPRTISLISVSNNGLFNLFSTDLHGQVDEEYYIVSLTVSDKACGQVQKAGKILICQLHAQAYQMIHGLEKNQVQELKPRENFPFTESVSPTLQLPLPQQAIAYSELALVESFTEGIHKIMLFKIIDSQQLADKRDALAHIHNSYATWRHKSGLAGNYLLR